MKINAVRCGEPDCFCKDWDKPVKPPQSFEGRVVELAKVLYENNPETVEPWEYRYSWSVALSDATDIILAADGYNIDGECTCD